MSDPSPTPPPQPSPPPLPEGEGWGEGEFVGSGSFRVDRKRALDKLMRFQMPDPAMWLLPWVRCAVASGATQIYLRTRPSGLEMSFNGLAFGEKDLEDPYSCLFEARNASARRDRDLAIGLLSVLRLSPPMVAVASGRGPDRRRLRVWSLEREALEPDPAPETETAIAVETSPEARRAAFEHVRERCAVSPIPIFIDGEEAPRGRQTEQVPGRSFEDGPIHGWLAVPPDPAPSSSFNAFTLGVFVNETHFTLPLVQVRGYVNDDQFALNASQTGVARNPRFKAAMDRLAGETERLLIETASSRASELAEIGRRLAQDPSLLHHWKDRIERGSAAENGTALGAIRSALTSLVARDPERREGLVKRIRWEARVTAWLREACQRLLSDVDRDVRSPALKALWEAAVYIGVDGKPLSLAELETQRKRLGYVPVSTEPMAGLDAPFEAVWCPSDKDLECLAARFRGNMRAVTDVLRQMKPGTGPSAGRFDPQVPPSLDRAGVVSLAIRDAMPASGPRGEVGLAAPPPQKDARLYLFEGGRTARCLVLESGLRFEAALEAPAPSATLADGEHRALAEAATTVAAGLYRKLAGEYDCWAASERLRAIREHLLDFLAWSRGPSPGPAPVEGHRWIEAVPLFNFGDAWIDYGKLLDQYRQGSPLCIADDADASKGLAGRRVLTGPRYSEAFLVKLLPEAAFLTLPGAAGVRVAYRRAPEIRCAHKAGCLAAAESGGVTVHLALPSAEAAAAGARTVKTPWGDIAVLPASERGLPGPSVAPPDPAGLEALIALVERGGTALDAPGSAARRFVLAATARFLAPWPGRGLGRREHLVELLEVHPMFRRPRGSGWTFSYLAGRLALGGGVTYAESAPDEVTAAQPDLILDADEAALVRLAWPGWQRHLEPLAERRALAAPIKPRAPAAAPEGSVPRLEFDEPMLYTRRHRDLGLEALLGLPARFPGPAPIFLKNGAASPAPAGFSAKTVALGAAVVDLTAWPGGKAGTLEAALIELWRRFFDELARHWPIADPSSVRHEVAVDFVLDALRRAGEDPEVFSGWDDATARLRRLTLFRTLGGDWADLDALKTTALRDKVLRYCDNFVMPCPEDARSVPVLKNPELVLLVLGQGQVRIPMRRLRPKTESAARPKTAIVAVAGAKPPLPGADGVIDLAAGEPPEAVVLLCSMLQSLRGRRGMKLATLSVRSVRLAETSDGSLLETDADGHWDLNPAHPAAAAILGSGLPPAEQAAYLATLVFTAVNRRSQQVTDLDDARFQEALADQLTSE